MIRRLLQWLTTPFRKASLEQSVEKGRSHSSQETISHDEVQRQLDEMLRGRWMDL